MVLEGVIKVLSEKFPTCKVNPTLDSMGRNIVTLVGEVDSWQRVVDIGHAVAKVEGVHNVVSNMTVKDLIIPKKDYTPYIEAGKKIGVIDEADVVIVGLGIVGCATARVLSRNQLKIIAVEMSEDVATGASKANNGGVHMAGMVKPGTLKARLSVKGNAMYEQWAKDLGFDFIRVGMAVAYENPEDLQKSFSMFICAALNEDYKPRVIGGQEVLELEPRLKEKGIKPLAAIHLPSQGQIHPYEAAVAMVENAVENGVKVLFNTTVGDVLVENGHVSGVITNKGIIRTRYIINCAGVYSDEIAAMAGDPFFTIHARRGTLIIIDKKKKLLFDNISVYKDTKYDKNEESKGGGQGYTPSYNVLTGPSAEEMPDKEDTETTRETLDYVMRQNQNPDITEADIIRLFAGTRPADFKEDYVIEKSPIAKGLITAGAVQSPGIGSSPAVAEMVEEILAKDMREQGEQLKPNPSFNPVRKPKIKFHKLSREEQDKLITQNPAYGRVVCRCETITEGEIIDAIHSCVVPTSIDAIKRRTRAGMGRCQGGFCQPRVLEILARELGKEWVEINLKGEGTNILKTANR